MDKGLSFTHLPYPSRGQEEQVLAYGSCGLLAHSLRNILTIYAEVEGNFVPLSSFTPFEHDITAMSWYDGSMCPNPSLPVLVAGSHSGRIAIIDTKSMKTIARYNCDSGYATSITWSPVSNSTFFVGTSTGILYSFNIIIKQIVNFHLVWKQTVPYSIQFIVIEPNLGNNAVIASKNGNIHFLADIMRNQPPALNNPLYLSDKTNEINNIDFYPSHQNYLLIATRHSSILYSLKTGDTINIIGHSDVMYIGGHERAGNQLISIRPDGVTMWHFNNGDARHAAEINISNSRIGNGKEILFCVKKYNRILLLTREYWLLTIEWRQHKLFVTHSFKLLCQKPLDIDCMRGSFAMVTGNGYLCVTKETSVYHDKYKELQQPQQQVLPSMLDMPSTLEGATSILLGLPTVDETPRVSKPAGSRRKGSRRGRDGKKQRCLSSAGNQSMQNIPVLKTAKIQRKRRNSYTYESKQSRNLLKQIAEEASKKTAKESIEDSIPKILNSEQKPINDGVEVLSNEYKWCLKVCDGALQRVKWITPTRLITWASFQENETFHCYIYMIDFENRSITPMMGKRLDSIGLPISNVIFSDNLKFTCVVFNQCLVNFITTASVPQKLASINFDTPVKVCFSPGGRQALVFTPDGKCCCIQDVRKERKTRWHQLDLKKGTINVVSWQKNGMFVGTSSGSFIQVGTIQPKLKWREVVNIKQPIKTLYSCGNSSFLIVNEKNIATIHSNGFDTTLPYPIKNVSTISPYFFLVRNNKRWSVVNSSGNFIKSRFSPATLLSPVFQTREKWHLRLMDRGSSTYEEMMETCRVYGLPLLFSVLQSHFIPEVAHEQMELLCDILKKHPQLQTRAMHLCLCLEQPVEYYRIGMSIMPDQVTDYGTILMKCAMVSSPNLVIEEVETIAAKLAYTERYSDAFELFFIANQWHKAVELALQLNRPLTATSIVRGRTVFTPELVEMTKKIYDYLQSRKSIGFGLVLIGGVYNLQDMIDLFGDIGENETADYIQGITLNYT